MRGEEAVIVADNVSKKFGGTVALESVSFNARPGEVLGLLGPNGSGKTTLIKILLGFLKPDSGRVSVAGLDPSTDPTSVRKLVGYVPETIELYESLTPRELFSLAARIRGLDERAASERAQVLSEAFELTSYLDTVVGALSKGNRQKVALVLALLHDPAVLVLDEPLTGLDVVSVRVLKEIIRQKVAGGGAVLFSTHVMEIAEKICDRILLMNKGRVVAFGGVEEVVSAAGSLEELVVQISGRASEIEEVLKALG